MTPALLTKAGMALYGATWQSDLARMLGVDARTVRRWIAGERSIPDAIRAELISIINHRVEKLDDVLAELSRR